ncbi:tetratricopeptide repeat protein [Candidatus Borreliella tachyglossi]|nr:tetratricopeptide repeat protein [Candidatus Borreliella tachyglossi]
MLKNIVYISLPENFTRRIKDFVFDPTILLPVEVNNVLNFSQIELNFEAIMSAILKISAYERDNVNFPYYKKLLLALNPNIFAELINAGLIKVDEGDYSLALEIFLALKGIDDKNEILLLNLALLYERMAENFLKAEQGTDALHSDQNALKIYEKLLGFKSPNENVFANAGFFFVRQYKLDKAQQLLKHYLKISDNSRLKGKVSEILNAIGNHESLDLGLERIYDLIILSREDEAISELIRLLKYNEGLWNAWFLLGWGYRRKGFYSEAKDAFLKVLFLDSKNVDAMNELSICFMELLELDDSLKYLLRALKLEPDNVKIISNLGILYLKMEHKKEALKYFKIVLEYDPKDSLALKYLELLDK